MSEKTVAKKLFIKENCKVLFINAPKDYESILGALPPNVTVLAEPIKLVDFIQVFVTSKKELEEQLNKLKSFLSPQGLLWVSYPKGTSKIKTDINRDIIYQFAQSIGLKGVAMISVDETWSAMRFKIV